MSQEATAVLSTMSSNARSTRSRHSLPPKGQARPLSESPRGTASIISGNSPTSSGSGTPVAVAVAASAATATATATATAAKASGERAFMMKWLEPPVQNKPSFEEDGMLRFGVVEHMAALGTRPKPSAVAAAIAALSEPEASPPEDSADARGDARDDARGDSRGTGAGTGGEFSRTATPNQPSQSVQPPLPQQPDAAAAAPTVRTPRIILRQSNKTKTKTNPPATASTKNTHNHKAASSATSRSPNDNSSGTNSSLAPKITRSLVSTTPAPEDLSSIIQQPQQPQQTHRAEEPPTPSSYSSSSSSTSSSTRKLKLTLSINHDRLPRSDHASPTSFPHSHSPSDSEPAHAAPQRAAKKSQPAPLSPSDPPSHKTQNQNQTPTQTSERPPKVRWSRRVSARNTPPSNNNRNSNSSNPPAAPPAVHSDDDLAEYADDKIRAKLADWYAAEMTPRQNPRDIMDKAMKYAVDLAINDDNIVTAYAIKVLWHDFSYDGPFIKKVFAVLSNNADASRADTDAINAMINERKRQGLKDRRAWKHFDEGDPLPAPVGPLPQRVRDELGLGPAPATTTTPATAQALADDASDQGSSDDSEDSADDEPAKATAPTPDANSQDPEVESIKGGKHAADGNDLDAKAPPAKKRRRSPQESDSSLSPPLSVQSSITSDDADTNAKQSSDQPTATATPQAPLSKDKAAVASRTRGSRNAEAKTTATTIITTTSATTAASASAISSAPGSATPSSLRASPTVAAGPLVPPPPKAPAAKSGSKKAAAKKEEDPKIAIIAEKKRQARERTAVLTPRDLSAVRPGAADAPEESNDMNRPSTPPPNRAGRVPRAAAVAASQTISTVAAATQAAIAATARSSRAGSKRPLEDADDLTPVATASTNGDSRASTPPLRPAKKQRVGLRVKTSPVKKGGSAAGVPRPHGRGQIPPMGFVDNDEYCSACGNSGEVVCCDSCPRSYHFECVDMLKEDGLPDEWFCPHCEMSRHRAQPTTNAGRPMSGLMASLGLVTPSAFRLRHDIRDHFEGVKASSAGDYEVTIPGQPKPPPTNNKKKVVEESIDFFPLVKSNGDIVLCHSCNKSSESTSPNTTGRPIISCSVCSMPWHLDCLDPPLAVPPVVKTWRCPLHVDDMIHSSFLYPAHRNREIKNAPVLTPLYSRGMKNNGLIEIFDDLSDLPDSLPIRNRGMQLPTPHASSDPISPLPTEAPEQLVSACPDPDSFGHVHLLQASKIALDTLERLGRTKRHNRAARRARAIQEKQLALAQQARNAEIAAVMGLLELSRPARPYIPAIHSTPPATPSPTEVCSASQLLDADIDSANEDQLMAIQAQAQALLTKVSQRLCKKQSSANGATSTADAGTASAKASG